MKRFNYIYHLQLFDRVRLMAKVYNISITKMMIELIEIGYIKMLEKNNI